jgi:hypothetical protein
VNIQNHERVILSEFVGIRRSLLTVKLVEHCKTSTKMTSSGKIVYGAEKDLVETRSIRRLRSKANCEGEEPADLHQIRRNDVIKLDAHYNLRQKNATISDNFVDMELSSDATSPPPNVPRAEQPFSSLSQPVSTTPSQRLNSIHEEARCPPSRIADFTVNKTSYSSFSTGAFTGIFCFHCERNSCFYCS